MMIDDDDDAVQYSTTRNYHTRVRVIEIDSFIHGLPPGTSTWYQLLVHTTVLYEYDVQCLGIFQQPAPPDSQLEIPEHDRFHKNNIIFLATERSEGQ